ncbi:MAG: alpha/beta-type small acid-soluble spore protein [Limnochordales bacterium]|nr:alpha/beta-type small acid-soluble spore protein [Limnochordales bacterium]
MAQGSDRSNRALIVQAAGVLDQFKYEVAYELGIDTSKIQSGYWGDLPSRDCGAVGGHMVRRMIAAAEQALIDQAAAGVRAGFAQALQGTPMQLNRQAGVQPATAAQPTSTPTGF